MNKNIKKLYIFIFLILLASCGFKKINQNDNSAIYIQNIAVIGDKKISYLLKNNILLISKKDSKNKYDLKLKIDKTKTSKIKNTRGEVTRYSLSVIVNLVMKNINNQKKISKSFAKNGDYDVAENHFKTINNEKNMVKNIIQQISNDIISFITLDVKSK